MSEYILRIDGVLYDGETGEALMNPTPIGEIVEIAEIVRCKDCKYRKVFEYHYKDIGYCVTECTRGNEGVIETCGNSGYCSLAERKERLNETD